MHPLLASPRRLLAYLAAWIPVLALLVYAMGPAGAAQWPAIAGLLGPACLIYAFACLSPWYFCRARPLRLAHAADLALTWLAASAAASLVLVGCAALAAYIFTGPPLKLPLLLGMGMLLYLLSGGLHYAAAAMEESRDAERRAAEARTLAREAELEALRMQLNPHFLFNSLHSISALAGADVDRARLMCARLAGFFRGTLRLGSRERIALRDELALARSYLDVERVRFGARLAVEEEIDPACEDCAVPALLLQPLVENAVKHGVADAIDPAPIRLAARRRGAAVAITIENGFDPDAPAPQSPGLGLAHVRRRLAACYGDDALLHTAPSQGIYRVSIRLPWAALTEPRP